MDYYAVLVLCFLPMVLLFVAIKFIVLMGGSVQEVKHVREESLKPHTYLEGVYDDLEQEDEWD